MDKQTTILLVGFGAVALFFMTRPAPAQQPFIIQQPAPPPAQEREQGGLEGIFSGVGRAIDGIIEIAK